MTLVLQMQETRSRSSSPVPSTGIESNSFKEPHVHLELMSSQHSSSGICYLLFLYNKLNTFFMYDIIEK